MAECLYYGYGCKKNIEEAVAWYRKAATKGSAAEQDKLGTFLSIGEGCEKSYIEAYKWWKKAAEQGWASAQNNLGNCYSEGKIIKEDKKKAYEWYHRAAEQEFVAAQITLATCLHNGTGCEVDKEQAIKWYCRVAEQGNVEAKHKVSRCLFEVRVENIIDSICDFLFGNPFRGIFINITLFIAAYLLFRHNRFLEQYSIILLIEDMLLVWLFFMIKDIKKDAKKNPQLHKDMKNLFQ